MQTKFEFKKQRDFGQIINDTFSFIRENFKPLLKAYVVICGVFVIGQLISTITQQWLLIESVNNAGGYARHQSATKFGLFSMVAVFFMVLTQLSISIMTVSYVSVFVAKGNQAPNTDEVWAYFKYYFFRVAGSSILWGLLLVLGFICCLIPAFYLLPFIVIMLPIMIIENGTFGYTFERSFKLVKDKFWFSLGVIIVVSLIATTCMYAVILPFSMLNIFSMFVHKIPAISMSLVALSGVFQTLAMVFYIIPAVASTLLYFALVEQKENTGLMDRISNFGTNEKQEDTRPQEY
ncbi:hypothetical protein [Pedobacter sp. MW01-1-1]|uniref:hypothetical protein n=1 Tax=Pedobacter sp. MW01-1-1 TaxID=3383027 RepID=UPI003FEF66A2